MSPRFSSLEICAGAGGQALGLEAAGFDPVLLLDDDPHACGTLSTNRPHWRILRADLKDFVGTEHSGVADVDLLSGGLPSAPFAVAGRQRGAADDRDLLRAAIFLAMDVRPRAIMLESTPNLLTNPRFADARSFVGEELSHMGYRWDYRVLDARDFGVPQTRRSGIIVALLPSDFDRFVWPVGGRSAPTVGEVLRVSMGSRGWPDAESWALSADQVAPTIVGGSKRHGGADLGPTGTKRAWLTLGVDGSGLGDQVPGSEFVLAPELGREGLPKLTVDQVKRLQALPDDWWISGRKTPAYRQVAQALPPPVAEAVGRSLAAAFA
ncbi:DNA cytosine methyltransferase [Nonomuraea longicatena]|uniref:DNA (cytosine-5-)-methyltransferase n=1 Tax=Nonomuraea longicatena TaxID=83682 RepID=A0ABP4AA86_9ACTN